VFAEDYMAMPVMTGRKSETERFAGALRTYSIEAMMQDKKALQAGTSHNLGQNFAKAFDTKFQGRDGKQHHVWQTSWGVSTRLIGGLIMTHSDDAGLVVPPKLAPTHVVMIPIFGKNAEDKPRVMEKVTGIAADLRKAGLSVIVDDDETKGPGWKYAEHELAGVCVRVELGPKDLEKGTCVVARRDTRTKDFVPLDQVVARVQATLDTMQKELFQKARDFREANTFEVNSYEEMTKRAEDGFMLAHWCEDPKCEAKAKQDLAVTTRNRPFNLKQEPGACAICGQPSKGRIVFSKAY
jgi:prolyl-tRNA synthetase